VRGGCGHAPVGGDGGDGGVEGVEGEKTSPTSPTSPPLICRLVRNLGYDRTPERVEKILSGGLFLPHCTSETPVPLE
jgi:hypothetical protein